MCSLAIWRVPPCICVHVFRHLFMTRWMDGDGTFVNHTLYCTAACQQSSRSRVQSSSVPPSPSSHRHPQINASGLATDGVPSGAAYLVVCPAWAAFFAVQRSWEPHEWSQSRTAAERPLPLSVHRSAYIQYIHAPYLMEQTYAGSCKVGLFQSPSVAPGSAPRELCCCC